jgi:hypothetical protein
MLYYSLHAFSESSEILKHCQCTTQNSRSALDTQRSRTAGSINHPSGASTSMTLRKIWVSRIFVPFYTTECHGSATEAKIRQYKLQRLHLLYDKESHGTTDTHIIALHGACMPQFVSIFIGSDFQKLVFMTEALKNIKNIKQNLFPEEKASSGCLYAYLTYKYPDLYCVFIISICCSVPG